MDCFIFWASIGVDKGYGETAFADRVGREQVAFVATVQEFFHQAVYQFAGPARPPRSSAR